jgi:hypothetical protein
VLDILDGSGLSHQGSLCLGIALSKIFPGGFGPKKESRAGFGNLMLDLRSTGWTGGQMKRSESEMRESQTQKHVQFLA